MKNVQTPAQGRRDHSSKLFAKIYNVFYCSKKTQQTTDPDNNNEDQEFNTAETDIDVVLSETSSVNDASSVTASGQDTEPEQPDTPEAQWFRAIDDCNVGEMKHLLDTKAVSVDCKDKHGWSGIHLSCWNGKLEVAECLLSHDASVDLDGPHGSTALALASQKGHMDLCKLLLQSNCNVNHTSDLGDAAKVTPLHLAAQNGHADIVKLLIDHGATVNAQMTVRGITAVTPLHLAVESNHMDVLDILIDAGCNIHQQTESGDTTIC